MEVQGRKEGRNKVRLVKVAERRAFRGHMGRYHAYVTEKYSLLMCKTETPSLCRERKEAWKKKKRKILK
jgi:hypothetical protein